MQRCGCVIEGDGWSHLVDLERIGQSSRSFVTYSIVSQVQSGEVLKEEIRMRCFSRMKRVGFGKSEERSCRPSRVRIVSWFSLVHGIRDRRSGWCCERQTDMWLLWRSLSRWKVEWGEIEWRKGAVWYTNRFLSYAQWDASFIVGLIFSNCFVVLSCAKCIAK